MSRVAYLVSRFPKLTETFVLFEMKALEELGDHVELFALRREPPGPRHREALPYEARAHFMPLLSRGVLGANLTLLERDPAKYLATWWRALRGTRSSPKFFAAALAWFPKFAAAALRMEERGVEHLHAHFAHHPALAAWVAHELTGLPYSFTAHGSDLHVDRTMLERKVASAAFVVAVSEYNRRIIADHCGESALDKTVVIHCGTDPTVFARDPGEVVRDAPIGYGVPLRIVCVASLEEVKGHRYLLRACRFLRRRGVPLHCDLVGDGRLASELRELVSSLGLNEHVSFHGSVPRQEVRQFLRRAHVAVQPSVPTPSGRREGIPVALMEAMMSGLPVVASAVSGIPELVRDGETGFLVPPADPWALADRLHELAVSPDQRTSFGRAGRRVVARDFDVRAGALALRRRIREGLRRTA